MKQQQTLSQAHLHRKERQGAHIQERYEALVRRNAELEKQVFDMQDAISKTESEKQKSDEEKLARIEEFEIIAKAAEEATAAKADAETRLADTESVLEAEIAARELAEKRMRTFEREKKQAQVELTNTRNSYEGAWRIYEANLRTHQSEVYKTRLGALALIGLALFWKLFSIYCCGGSKSNNWPIA